MQTFDLESFVQYIKQRNLATEHNKSYVQQHIRFTRMSFAAWTPRPKARWMNYEEAEAGDGEMGSSECRVGKLLSGLALARVPASAQGWE